jgi:hypothetical protein
MMEAHAPRERPASQLLPAVQRMIANYAPGLAIILFCCALWSALILNEGPRITLLDDAGYGDSYVAYDVQQYRISGVMYRDLSRPPYTPSVYGPLLYVLYSVPGRIRAWDNPFLGMRLVSVASFLLCIAMAVSIVRKLFPNRYAWAWALLLSGSIASMHLWVLQLRGDFPAIFLSLTAIRLLLVETPWAVLLAGACAGCATQFKFTMAAALAAGSLWFLGRRRWKDLARFASAGLLASAGSYALWAAHERRIIPQLASLRIGVVDIAGSISMIMSALSEPVVLLAIAAIPVIQWKTSPRSALLILFTVFSWVIAAVTGLHPGANINYLYEGLFALIPAAVLGVYEITALGRENTGLALFIAAVFVLGFAYPSGKALYKRYGPENRFRAVAADNASCTKPLRGSNHQALFFDRTIAGLGTRR